jgi:hypothetical protein
MCFQRGRNAWRHDDFIDFVATRHRKRHRNVTNDLELDELVEELIKRFLSSETDLATQQKKLLEAKELRQTPGQPFRSYMHQKKVRFSEAGVTDINAHAASLCDMANSQLKVAAGLAIQPHSIWNAVRFSENANEFRASSATSR